MGTPARAKLVFLNPIVNFGLTSKAVYHAAFRPGHRPIIMNSTNKIHLSSRFQLREIILHVHGQAIHLATVANLDRIVDEITPEEFAVDERLPYWADLWHSSIALSQFVFEHVEDIQNASVLELGCGLGLAGIVAARCGGIVTFSDNDEDALLFARHNLAMNVEQSLSARCRFIHLDWREVPQDQCDIILCSDLIYEKRIIEPLLQFLSHALKPSGSIFLTEPHRSIADSFFTALHAYGFRIDSFDRLIEHDSRSVIIGVHRIQFASQFNQQTED